MVELYKNDITTPMASTSNSEQAGDKYGIELLNKSAVNSNIEDNSNASWNYNQNGNTSTKDKNNQHSLQGDHILRRYQEYMAKMNNEWIQTDAKPSQTISSKSRHTKRDNAKMDMENTCQTLPGKPKSMINWDKQGSPRRKQKSDAQQRRSLANHQKGFASSSYIHHLKQMHQPDARERNSSIANSARINHIIWEPISSKTTSQLHAADHTSPTVVAKESSETKWLTENRDHKSQIDWSSGGDGSQAIQLVQLTSHSFSDIENYSLSTQSSQTSLTSKSSSTFCPYCDKIGTSASSSDDHVYEYDLRSTSWSLARSALREALSESIKETNQMKGANQNTSCRPSGNQKIKGGQVTLDDIWQSNNANNEQLPKDKKRWRAYSERNASIGSRVVDKIFGKNKKQQGNPRMQKTSRKVKKSKSSSSKVNHLELSNEHPPSEPILEPMGYAKFKSAASESKHDSKSRSNKNQKITNEFSADLLPISIQHIPNDREASRIAAKALIRLNKAASVHSKSPKNRESIKFDQNLEGPIWENHSQKVKTTSGKIKPHSAEHGRSNHQVNSRDIVIKPFISTPAKQQSTHPGTLKCIESKENKAFYKQNMDKSGKSKLEVPYKSVMAKPGVRKSKQRISFAPTAQSQNESDQPSLSYEGDEPHKHVEDEKTTAFKKMPSIGLINSEDVIDFQRLINNIPERNETIQFSDKTRMSSSAQSDHSNKNPCPCEDACLEWVSKSGTVKPHQAKVSEHRVQTNDVWTPANVTHFHEAQQCRTRSVQPMQVQQHQAKVSEHRVHTNDVWTPANITHFHEAQQCRTRSVQPMQRLTLPCTDKAKPNDDIILSSDVWTPANITHFDEAQQCRTRSVQPIQRLTLPCTDKAKPNDDIILSSFSPYEKTNVKSILFENVPRVSKLNKNDTSLSSRLCSANSMEQSRDVHHMLQHKKCVKENNLVHNTDACLCKYEIKPLQATVPKVQSFDKVIDERHDAQQNRVMKGMLDFELLAASVKGKDAFLDAQSVQPDFKSMPNKIKKICDVELLHPYLSEKPTHTSKHIQNLEDVSTNTDEAWERLKTGIPSSLCTYPRNSSIWNLVQTQCASKSSSETTFLTARSNSFMQLVGPVDELIMQNPTDYCSQTPAILQHHNHANGSKNGNKDNRYSMFHALYPFTVYSTTDVSNDEGHAEGYTTSNSGQSGDHVSLGNPALDIITESVASNSDYEPLKYITESSSELIVCTAGDSDIKCSGGDHANVSDEEHFAVHVLTSLADEKGYESETSNTGRAKYVQEIRLRSRSSMPLSEEAIDLHNIRSGDQRSLHPGQWAGERSLRFSTSTRSNTNPDFRNLRLGHVAQGHTKSFDNHTNGKSFECDSDDSSIKVKFATQIGPTDGTRPQSYNCMKRAVCPSLPSKINVVNESLTDVSLSSDSAHTLVYEVNHSKSKAVDHICYARL